jgi:hypothetical protein
VYKFCIFTPGLHLLIVVWHIPLSGYKQNVCTYLFVPTLDQFPGYDYVFSDFFPAEYAWASVIVYIHVYSTRLRLVHRAFIL